MINNLFALQDWIESINEHKTILKRLNEVIDWEIFRQPIEEVFKKEPKGKGGRPPFDRVMMFKILILQDYYNLSDAQTEFQIKDRLSFMQFLGLNIGDKVPDEKTIWHFRETLSKSGIEKKLFELFNQELTKHNIMTKKGAIVDATFVEVPKQRNTKKQNEDIKKGAIPLEFAKKNKKERRDILSQKDTDARWTKKGDKRYFGYKNHIGIDKDTKIITNYEVTDASVHDSQVIDKLVDEDTKDVWADSAYKSKEIEKRLKVKGCKTHFNEKAYKNKPLTKEQKELNKKKSKIRSKVEHVFGFMKNSMNGFFSRYIGFRRNKFKIGLRNLIYNLCRYEQLVRLKRVKVTIW